MSGLFGHCPNSDCTPPFTQTGTLGHFISGPIWANAIWTLIFTALVHPTIIASLLPLEEGYKIQTATAATVIPTIHKIFIPPAVNVSLIILVKLHVQTKCFNNLSPLKCKVAASPLHGRNFSFLGLMHTYQLHPHLGWKDTGMLLQYRFKIWKWA